MSKYHQEEDLLQNLSNQIYSMSTTTTATLTTMILETLNYFEEQLLSLSLFYSQETKKVQFKEAIRTIWRRQVSFRFFQAQLQDMLKQAFQLSASVLDNDSLIIVSLTIHSFSRFIVIFVHLKIFGCRIGLWDQPKWVKLDK